MKKRDSYIVFILIILMLLIAIIFTITSLTGRSSKQVKRSMLFVKQLSKASAIYNDDLPEAGEYKEIKNSAKDNSFVKYTLVTKDFGINMDKDYNIVGFINNTEINHSRDIITKENAANLAERYLKAISKEEFRLREVKENIDQDSEEYTIFFNRYSNGAILYNSDIVIKINKYSGELIAYTGMVDKSK